MAETEDPDYAVILDALVEAPDEESLCAMIAEKRSAGVGSSNWDKFLDEAERGAKARRKELVAKGAKNWSTDERAEMARVMKILKSADPIRKGVWTVLFDDYERRHPQPAQQQQQPTIDQRLVGAWDYTTYRSTGDFSIARTQFLVLRADGSCSLSWDTQAHLTTRNIMAGERTESDAGGGSEQRGRWRADPKHLRLQWPDGESVFTYELSSEGMLLTPAPGTKDQATYWKRVQ